MKQRKLQQIISYILRFQKIFFILFFVAICCAVFFLIQDSLDPDFGWHFRMGQLILAKGIPKTDPFSYTMPSYPFVDHEWLTNVFFAFLYSRLGLVGLSLLFTVLAYSALLLQVPFLKKQWLGIPLILAASALSSYMGIRTQVLSWDLFSLVLLCLLYQPLWRKIRYFLPLLFLLWVNLHASFALGVILVLIALCCRMYEQKRIDYIDVFVFLGILLVTCCNPYTYRIWWEVWMQMSDNSLHWSIQEWLPTFFFLNFGLLALLPFSVIFVVLERKHFSLTERVLYILLVLFGLESARNLPYWLILAIPLTVKAITRFVQNLENIPYAPGRFAKAYAVYGFFAVLGICMQVFFPLFMSDGKPHTFYPKDAIGYIRQHPSSGQIFSEYAWGGYLIWKLPEKKVFIDGRMPSWRRTTAPASESLYAFHDYQNVLTGDLAFVTVAKKYDIDTAIVAVARTKKTKHTWEETVENLLHIQQVKVDFKTQMKQAGMKLVYTDSVAAIYRKE